MFIRIFHICTVFILLSSQTIAKDGLEADSTSIDIQENSTITPLDSTDTSKTEEGPQKDKKTKEPFIHQLRIGVDLSRILVNVMYPSKQAYGFQADYALRRELYISAETGFGRGKVDYEHLKYHTDAFFFKIGIDKSFLDRLGIEDFDMGYLGFRYGLAAGNRSDADFTVMPSVGNPSSGHATGQTFLVHWGEITGGIKVEVWKRVFLGWSFSGKFMMNPTVFKELSPSFIPGYGKGDKTTSFDFNFYLNYALRWKSK